MGNHGQIECDQSKLRERELSFLSWWPHTCTNTLWKGHCALTFDSQPYHSFIKALLCFFPVSLECIGWHIPAMDTSVACLQVCGRGWMLSFQSWSKNVLAFSETEALCPSWICLEVDMTVLCLSRVYDHKLFCHYCILKWWTFITRA